MAQCYVHNADAFRGLQATFAHGIPPTSTGAADESVGETSGISDGAVISPGAQSFP